MKAKCIITNCRKSAPSGEAFCAEHREEIGLREAPSPDVMEVWRDAQKIWVKETTSWPWLVDHSAAEQAAANVIAEAKARWEREALERAARMRGALEDAKQSLALAIYGLPEMLENNALSDEEGMVPALQAAVERMESVLKGDGQ